MEDINAPSNGLSVAASIFYVSLSRYYSSPPRKASHLQTSNRI